MHKKMKNELSKALNSGRCVICFLIAQDESNELREFIRKDKPALRRERNHDEKLSYYRTIEKITGREGIRW